MELLIEIIKFMLYSFLIVIISKYILVVLLRKLAENLDLKAKTVGNIAGIATSVPELLSVSFSAGVGLIDTSIYNILSSNIINMIQYLSSIFLNKNQKVLRNKALQIDIILVIITILIPLVFVCFKVKIHLSMIPIFLLLLFLFYYLNKNSHQLYLKKEEERQEKEIEEEKKWVKGKTNLTVRYIVYLVITGVFLFVVGDLLGSTLENLSYLFHIPEWAIGIALGFITSLPELVTFIEAQKHHKKKHHSAEGVVEATNNLLTSNVMNLFVIQTIGIVLYTIFR